MNFKKDSETFLGHFKRKSGPIWNISGPKLQMSGYGCTHIFK